MSYSFVCDLNDQVKVNLKVDVFIQKYKIILKNEHRFFHLFFFFISFKFKKLRM